MIYLSDRDGFTLIELVLVLAVLAMAASVTMVSIGRTGQRALIRDEASLLQGALRKARMESLLRRVPVALIINTESGDYSLSKGNRGAVKLRDIPQKLTLSGSQEIVFFPKGNSTGGNLELTGPGGRIYNIEVDRVTGLARLRRL
jgi:general secretion pathway protein H